MLSVALYKYNVQQTVVRDMYTVYLARATCTWDAVADKTGQWLQVVFLAGLSTGQHYGPSPITNTLQQTYDHILDPHRGSL